MTTVPGIEYVVTTASTCTVTDGATGTELVTAYAGQQAVFQAISESVTLSDPDATVKARRRPFESAPGEALSLTGGSALPAGYTRLEFLRADGNQWIVSPSAGSAARGARARYSYDTDSGAAGWAFCAFAGGTSDIFGAMRTGVGMASPWLYGWQGIPSLEVGGEVVENGKVYEVFLNFRNDMLIRLRTPSGSYHSALKTPAKQTSAPVHIGGIAGTPQNLRGNIYLYQETQGAEIGHSMLPAIDPTGEPCMYDLVTRRAYKNNGTGQFVAGVGTVAQLTNLLRNLPATGGTLTLSLPAEANTPEVAEQLQACHDSKGWTLTVLEYRPAPVATYTLRRVREVVWCRREQSALGSYVDATGKSWHLERCAAIFGRLGNDPTAYGYTPYDSVEQAAEVWELQPYVDPEAMGDNGTLEQGGTENTSPETKA